MKKATVNDYFRHHWMKLMLFALFTAAVSFFAPLKNFQLKWLIDSKSKQEALGYMGLVFLITFTSWFFERLSRRSFTKLACGAVEQVRGQVMERVLGQGQILEGHSSAAGSSHVRPGKSLCGPGHR